MVLLTKDRPEARADDRAPRHRFTVDDFQRLGTLGFFNEDDRVELIWGEIVDMVPMGPRHASGITAFDDLLRPLVPGLKVRVQLPIDLGDSEPFPDIALVKPGDYAEAHPVAADVALVIEVSDSTIRSDQREKALLYSEKGIPEYWLSDLTRNQLVVHSEPTLQGYRKKVEVPRTGTIVSATILGLTLKAAAVLALPRRKSR